MDQTGRTTGEQQAAASADKFTFTSLPGRMDAGTYYQRRRPSSLGTAAWLLFAMAITFACVHETVKLWNDHLIVEVR